MKQARGADEGAPAGAYRCEFEGLWSVFSCSTPDFGPVLSLFRSHMVRARLLIVVAVSALFVLTSAAMTHGPKAACARYYSQSGWVTVCD